MAQRPGRALEARAEACNGAFVTALERLDEAAALAAAEQELAAQDAAAAEAKAAAAAGGGDVQKAPESEEPSAAPKD